MQILIDISEVSYKYLQSIIKAGEEPLGYAERVIMRGTVIPKDATNGDVVKTMFPNLEKDKERLVQQYGSQALYDTYEKWCKLPYKETNNG